MEPVDAVLGLIDLQPKEMRRAQGVLSWWAPAIAAIFLGTFVLMAWVNSDHIRMAWRDGQWDNHVWHDRDLQWMFPIGTTGIQFIGFAAKALLRMSPKQIRTGVLALRRAAAAGDERLAPQATTLLSLLRQERVPSTPAQFGPFKRPNGAEVLDDAATGGVLLLFGGVLIVFGVIPGAGLSPQDRFIVLLICAGLGMLLSMWGISYLTSAFFLRSRIIVAADEWGLRWMRPGWRKRECRIAWLEARSFSMIAHHGALVDLMLSPLSFQRVAFVLDSPAATLAWDIARGDNEEAVQRSDQLAALIVARTHLPLRDLSVAATKVTTQRWRKQFAEVRSVFIGEGQTSALWPEMPHFLTSRKIALMLLGAALIPLVLFSSVYMTAYALQRYQAQYYNDLLAQVHSHAPLYHDALTVPDSDWPVHAPTVENPSEYAFKDGAYQLSGTAHGDNPFLSAATSSTYGDAAVEVTTRQFGEGDYVGLGLLLHANDSAKDFSEFVVSPPGTWFLFRHGVPSATEQERAFGSSQGNQYVHGQYGAANKLTVIMHGAEYVCYINDQFVGIYHDPAPHAGHVGVVLEDYGGITGAFTNFTVYPV